MPIPKPPFNPCPPTTLPPQVTGVFARRGYNVQSLAVGNSEREGMSRITMVVPASTTGIANLIKQLNKLVYVEKVSSEGRSMLAFPVPYSAG